MKLWKIRAGRLSTGKQWGTEGCLGNRKMWRVRIGWEMGKWETQGTVLGGSWQCSLPLPPPVTHPAHSGSVPLLLHSAAAFCPSALLLTVQCIVHCTTTLHCRREGGDSLRPPCYALRKILQYSIHDTTLPIIHSHYIHCKMNKAQVYTIHLVLTKMLLKDSHNSWLW